MLAVFESRTSMTAILAPFSFAVFVVPLCFFFRFTLSGLSDHHVSTDFGTFHRVRVGSSCVNVPCVRNIVFFKYVNSPISFYQMVGRGTRIDPATNKLMFRVYDYTNATRLFGQEFLTKFVRQAIREPKPEYEVDKPDSPAPKKKAKKKKASGSKAKPGPLLSRLQSVLKKVQRDGEAVLSRVRKEAALVSRDAYQGVLSRAGLGKITTEILDAPEFYFAEDYHQQYLAKNPGGYCGLGGTGVSCPIGLAEAR